MTRNLNRTLNQANRTTSQFARNFGKNFIAAGVGVTMMAAGIGFGMTRLIGRIARVDEELTQFADNLGVTREEAFATKSALDAMGKTIEEIAEDPRLLRQFEELRENAERIGMPDMSEGLEQVRGISTAFTKLKQTAMAGLQWVGHYILKYAARPLQDINGILNGMNDTLIRNVREWAQRIGQALGWIIQLGTTLIRGAGLVFNAIKRIFDMIPNQVLIAIGAFAALAAFLKMGPIGKLITILTAALMLLDDFFTFLDGGEALLGPVWQILTDLFSGFTSGGENALEFFSGTLLPGIFDAITRFFPVLVDKIMSFVEPIIDFSVQIVEGIIRVVTDNLPRLVQMLGDVANSIIFSILDMLPRLIDMGTQLITSLITGIVDMVPRLIDVIIGIVFRLYDTITAVLPQILEAGVNLVMSLVDGIVSTLPVIIRAAVDLVGAFIRLVVENLPRIIQAGIDMLLALAGGILSALPELLDAVLGLIPMVVEMLMNNLPLVLDAGINIITSLINGLVSMLPRLIDVAINLVVRLIDTIVRMLPDIIQMGIQLVMSLIQGIVNALPQIIQAIITLLTSVIDAVISNLPRIIQAGIQIVLALILGIVDAVPQLIQAVIELIPVIVGALIGALPQIIEAGIQLLVSLITGIVSAIPELIAAIPQIIAAILGGLAQLPGMLIDLGRSLITSLWDGIKSMGSWIRDKVGGFFRGIWDGVTSIFRRGNSNEPMPAGGHAEGVISTSEHDARISEGDQPEAVIPLSKPSRAKQLLKRAASFIGLSGDRYNEDGLGAAIPAAKQGSSAYEFVKSAFEGLDRMVKGINVDAAGGDGARAYDKMIAFIDQASACMQQMNQLAEASAMTAGSSVVNDYRNIDLSTSYSVYGSESPQATADAIDRMQELRTRNNKGVIQ